MLCHPTQSLGKGSTLHGLRDWLQQQCIHESSYMIRGVTRSIIRLNCGQLELSRNPCCHDLLGEWGDRVIWITCSQQVNSIHTCVLRVFSLLPRFGWWLPGLVCRPVSSQLSYLLFISSNPGFVLLVRGSTGLGVIRPSVVLGASALISISPSSWENIIVPL